MRESGQDAMKESIRLKKNFKKAIIVILIADLMVAIQAIFIKLISPDLGTNVMVFGRSFVNLVLLIIWTLCNSHIPSFLSLFKTKVLKYHLIRSLGGVGALYCFYFSIKYLSLSPATLLFFTLPIFVPLIARVWLRVKLIHRLWFGIIPAFIGITFVLRPGTGLFEWASLIALLGGVIGAIAFISVRLLQYTESTESIMLYYFVLCVVVSAIVLAIYPQAAENYFSFYALSMLTLAGIFAALFQYLMTYAARFAPMRFLSPFLYFSVVLTSIADVVVWHAPLHMGLVIGFILIVIGATLLVFLYPKNDRTIVPKKKVT